jgi:hypothetical protein
MAQDGTTRPGYMSATQAAAYLSVSRSLFFELVKDYASSAGRLGIGPTYYPSPRAPRWKVADLDRCMARYARQPAAQERLSA